MMNTLSPAAGAKGGKEARAWLSLGGNMGGAEAHFNYALAQLAAGGCRIIAASSLYITPAWGQENQPDFSNICLEIATRLPPAPLLALCLEIEKQRGRQRRQKWGPRSLDIDIIVYENYRSPPGAEDLILPHPYCAERAFVMLPLAEICPRLAINGKTAAQWAAELMAAGAAKGIIRQKPAALWAKAAFTTEAKTAE